MRIPIIKLKLKFAYKDVCSAYLYSAYQAYYA